MEREASVPLYTKWMPRETSLMPWKFGDVLNERRSMPRKVLGGKFRKRSVDVGVVEVMVECLCRRWRVHVQMQDFLINDCDFYIIGILEVQLGKINLRSRIGRRTLESFYCSYNVHARCGIMQRKGRPGIMPFFAFLISETPTPLPPEQSESLRDGDHGDHPCDVSSRMVLV